jgi:hypothetical protein
MASVNDVKKSLTVSQVYRNRIRAVKPTLPRAWREIFFSHYPDYEKGALRRKLENVFACSSSDVFITETLEQINSAQLKMKAAWASIIHRPCCFSVLQQLTAVGTLLLPTSTVTNGSMNYYAGNTAGVSIPILAVAHIAVTYGLHG